MRRDLTRILRQRYMTGIDKAIGWTMDHHFPTNFIESTPPLGRLPAQWEAWEQLFDKAVRGSLKLGDAADADNASLEYSRKWREGVRNTPQLETKELLNESLPVLQRAHHVLAAIVHFYAHTHPSAPQTEVISFPKSLSVPLLQVSAKLDMPPVFTYSDEMLYNWSFVDPERAEPLAIDNLRSNPLFTGTKDEEEFNLTSLRIEVTAREGLEVMKAIFVAVTDVGSADSSLLILQFHRVVPILQQMKSIFLQLRSSVQPDIFYHQIRRWISGRDTSGPQWVFEGLDAYPELHDRVKLEDNLLGSTAAQSSILAAFDAYLGVDEDQDKKGRQNSMKPGFILNMDQYRPAHHRAALESLRAACSPSPIRRYVFENADDVELVAAYNAVVTAVKEFRDAHIIIVTSHVLQPGKREAAAKATGEVEVKGTGGSNPIVLLKDIRDGTNLALVGKN